MIEYKFNENEILKEIQKYVDSTYEQHYATGKIQSTEFIIDIGHGLGFTIGNIIKYAQRYGKKNGYDEKDLYKIIHYAIILLGQKIKEEDEFREYEQQIQMDMD